MMNKKNLCFLTLFSLVLVLSIYYVTMPNDLLAASTTSSQETKTANEKEVTTEQSDAITALKVEDEAKTKDTLSELQEKLTNASSTTEEKNNAYEQIKNMIGL